MSKTKQQIVDQANNNAIRAWPAVEDTSAPERNAAGVKVWNIPVLEAQPNDEARERKVVFWTVDEDTLGDAAPAYYATDPVASQAEMDALEAYLDGLVGYEGWAVVENQRAEKFATVLMYKDAGDGTFLQEYRHVYKDGPGFNSGPVPNYTRNP